MILFIKEEKWEEVFKPTRESSMNDCDYINMLMFQIVWGKI